MPIAQDDACFDDCCAPQAPAVPIAQDDACFDDCCAPQAAAESVAQDACVDDCCAPATAEARAVDGGGGQDDCCAPDAAARLSASVGRVSATDEGSAAGARTVVRVTGMDCASCAVTIEKRVGQLPGVHRATVNFAAGRLDAEHDEGLAREVIEEAVVRAGYGIERGAAAEREAFWTQPRVLLTVAGLAIFLLAHVLALVGASDTVTNVAYVVATAVGGLPIYRAAVASAMTRVADINVLMTLAVIGAVAIGAWGEASLVVILFAVSNALQVYAVGRTRGSVRALARLAPNEVLVRRDGREVEVPVEEVLVGDLVVVRPGERIGVDGEVLEGASALDESPVTGESTPAEKGVGDPVYSGSLNGAGGLVLRVTKDAGASTLQRITRMVEEAQGTKAPIEQFVSRFSRVYTPIVLVAALLVALVPPLLGGEFSTWFYRALVLLIVSCPCALVISTPVSVVSAIGAASRRGILIKGGSALEASGKLTTMFFDKTGTLTEGRPVVERVISRDGADEASVLRVAAALERRSEHPLAHAILAAAGDAELPEVQDFRSIPGRGAEGMVGGRRHLVGSPRLYTERGISLEPIAADLRVVEDAGETPVIVGDERGPVAVLGLADAIRQDAHEALDALRRIGVERLVMLTGDADAPARRVAEELGIEYRAQLLPEDKVAAIRELAPERGSAGMVGDGINDAPALAAADVSFAMGAAGTDAALEAADIALMADDLSKVADAVELSRRAERMIKQNIVASIVFNTGFTVLAPIGLIPLWLAVLEDAVTSTGVTANSLRLFRTRTRSDRRTPRRPSAGTPARDGAALASGA
ncbi:cation-translocating P-type ATPase [Patulibacter brassicae]|uniref:Cation-translocating P-type ATPase n=1 Tax=Patulibacter brassicae TaxID=1705717 RepID=A0ABU4VNF4_9ACTN|nr:cation-translocating P-type ATPase [Patulibacter brassicae]MDX8153384.1 cation-translocating P-type ATPase [Patulibacter brassicae]